MRTTDQARAADADMAAAIFGGPFLLQMIAWRSFIARHEASLGEASTSLAAALRRFVDLREQGLTAGGPALIAIEDVEKADRMAALVSAWLAGGELSPEIEPLARHLFAVLGGAPTALPPAN